MAKKNIQALIFDFDGVLFDSSRLHFEAMQIVLSELEIDLSYETYRQKYFGVNDLVIFQNLLPKIYSDPVFIRSLLQKKIKIFLEKVHHDLTIPAIPGVLDFLKNIENMIFSRAIFSNGNGLEVNSILEKLECGELKSYFQFVTTIDDVTYGKPNPEGYLLSAKKLKINPEHCLVIEDSLEGLRAGKSAGMTVIGLATTYEKKILKPHADFVAESYKDAWEFVSNQTR